MGAKDSTDPSKAPNPGQSKPGGGKAGTGPDRKNPNDDKRRN